MCSKNFVANFLVPKEVMYSESCYIYKTEFFVKLEL